MVQVEGGVTCYCVGTSKGRLLATSGVKLARPSDNALVLFRQIKPGGSLYAHVSRAMIHYCLQGKVGYGPGTCMNKCSNLL